jgi:hypothetical protein
MQELLLSIWYFLYIAEGSIYVFITYLLQTKRTVCATVMANLRRPTERSVALKAVRYFLFLLSDCYKYWRTGTWLLKDGDLISLEFQSELSLKFSFFSLFQMIRFTKRKVRTNFKRKTILKRTPIDAPLLSSQYISEARITAFLTDCLLCSLLKEI